MTNKMKQLYLSLFELPEHIKIVQQQEALRLEKERDLLEVEFRECHEKAILMKNEALKNTKLDNHKTTN